jgi:hypothetical protein
LLDCNRGVVGLDSDGGGSPPYGSWGDGRFSRRGKDVLDTGIVGAILGDSWGVVGWLLIVGGRGVPPVAERGLRLYFEVGGMAPAFALTDATEERPDIICGG